MFIKSKNLSPIVKLDLEKVRAEAPVIYNWIITNSKRIGMHPSKFQRELGVCLDAKDRVIDLTDRYTRLVRCRISH